MTDETVNAPPTEEPAESPDRSVPEFTQNLKDEVTKVSAVLKEHFTAPNGYQALALIIIGCYGMKLCGADEEDAHAFVKEMWPQLNTTPEPTES